jgi:uncharacterized phiE125 gp8 family phage protein
MTLAQLKAHLRVSTSAEDDLLASYLAAARNVVEEHTRRALISQTWALTLDRWPDSRDSLRLHNPVVRRFAGRAIELPRPPLQSVTSISYLRSADGVSAILDAGHYDVDTSGLLGRVVLRSGKSWPDLADAPSAITITYVAGYGATAADVPPRLLAAIRWMVAHLYEVRAPVNIGNIVNDIPFTLRSILDSARVPLYA